MLRLLITLVVVLTTGQRDDTALSYYDETDDCWKEEDSELEEVGFIQHHPSLQFSLTSTARK